MGYFKNNSVFRCASEVISSNYEHANEMKAHKDASPTGNSVPYDSLVNCIPLGIQPRGADFLHLRLRRKQIPFDAVYIHGRRETGICVILEFNVSNYSVTRSLRPRQQSLRSDCDVHLVTSMSRVTRTTTSSRSLPCTNWATSQSKYRISGELGAKLSHRAVAGV